MKAERKEMPLWQKIFYMISFVFLIAAFIYLGQKNYSLSKSNLTDNERFTEEYGISSKNIFVYKTAEEILKMMNTGDAIIFMAFPENKWSSKYAELLNEVAMKNNIQEIYYYNFKQDRSSNNQNYQKIVSQLSSYLPVLDEEVMDIYAPTVVIVKDGNIIFYDDETSIIRGDTSVDDYWTVSRENEKKIEFRLIIQEYLEEEM